MRTGAEGTYPIGISISQSPHTEPSPDWQRIKFPLLQELDAINVERSAKYDSDPEFRKIAGTAADPYASRIKALQDTLERNRSGGAGKP